MGMTYFRQALELHPDYAEAHAASAQGYMLLAIFSVTPPRHVMPIAIQSAMRALELNPRLAEGQLAMAWARHWYDWNWAGAEEFYRRAVELTPGDSWPRMCYATFLGLRGRLRRSHRGSATATELDPVSAIISRGVSDVLMMGRRFDEAIEHATKAIALEPSFSSMYWSLALAQAGNGLYSDAVATLEQGHRYGQGDATLESFLGWAYGRAGPATRRWPWRGNSRRAGRRPTSMAPASDWFTRASVIWTRRFAGIARRTRIGPPTAVPTPLHRTSI